MGARKGVRFFICGPCGRFPRPFVSFLVKIKFLLQLHRADTGRFLRLRVFVAELKFLGRRFLQIGQLCQAFETQIIQKFLRCSKERRSSRRLPPAHGFDPSAVLKLLEKLRGERDAADFLDVASRHRLPVGNDGKRFHRGAGVAGRALLLETREPGHGSGRRAEAPAAVSELLEPHAAVFPEALERLELLTDRLRGRPVIEKTPHLPDGQGLSGREKRRLENGLRGEVGHMTR